MLRFYQIWNKPSSAAGMWFVWAIGKWKCHRVHVIYASRVFLLFSHADMQPRPFCKDYEHITASMRPRSRSLIVLSLDRVSRRKESRKSSCWEQRTAWIHHLPGSLFTGSYSEYKYPPDMFSLFISCGLPAAWPQILKTTYPSQARHRLPRSTCVQKLHLSPRSPHARRDWAHSDPLRRRVSSGRGVGGALKWSNVRLSTHAPS